MMILIKPLLYLVAFAPMAVLFASMFGLACWLGDITEEFERRHRKQCKRGQEYGLRQRVTE